MPTRGKQVALGLDVGGTKIKALALEAPDKVLVEYAGPSEAKSGPRAVRKAIATAVDFFRSMDIPVQSIGIGCAGSVEPITGIVRNSPNFADWSNVPLKDWIESDYNVPVVVDNDANCAVYGEWKLGSAAGCHNVVLLTIGTGIGGGLILDNRLFRGSTGTGGELGHFSIRSDGKWCNCGNRGCFERYCSATALKEVAGTYSAEEIFALPNDTTFKSIIQDFLNDFQIGLTSIANTFDPDCLLIGGAVSKGIARYLKDIEAWVKAHAFPAVAAKMRLSLTRHGNLSGALGSALISLDSVNESASRNVTT